MASGTRLAKNNSTSLRSLSAAIASSKSLRSAEGGRPSLLVVGVQRASLSDQTLSPSSIARPSMSSHPRNVKLPTLSVKSSSKKPAVAKPCRKNSSGKNRSTSQPNQKAVKEESSKQGPQSKKPGSKPKAVPILMAITPENVEEEKFRFFSRDFDYNPQFTYRNPPSAKALARHSKASDKLIKPAVQVFTATLKKFRTYKRFEATTGGRPISCSQFTAVFQQYLSQEGLTNKVSLHLSDSLVARALMTRMNGRPTLNARPSALRSDWANGLLQHEIGTHYIRSANNRSHPWSSSKGRRRHRLGPVNPTEEGIASLHSVLLRKEPFLWRAAMLYYATFMASKLSFADLFRGLGTYIEDPEVRWDYCLRAKRGQTDTSRPGCFRKDQVYLEGALRALRYRHVIDFHSLYKLGRVALEDVERLKSLVDLDSADLKIPSFMADIVEYRKRLDYVFLKNGLDDRDLAILFPEETPVARTVALTVPDGQQCPDEQGEDDDCSTNDELVER